MFGFNEILLCNLSGKHLEIAKLADSDKNEKLTGGELSVFLMECETEGIPYCGEKGVKNRLVEFSKLLKNIFFKEDLQKSNFTNYNVVTQNLGNKKIKVYDNINGDKLDAKIETELTNDIWGNVTVNYSRVQISRTKKILSQEASFTYNIANIEEYIINGASKKGNKITYFKEIPVIRALPEAERTEEQKSLLNEFNDLIKYVTQIGTDYGIDPKQIVAIIQEEVEFDGLGKKRDVTTSFGQGYMQLTSSVITDILGLKSDGTYEKYLKLDEYGVEIIELLESRGFDIQNVNTDTQKKALSGNIMDYLRKNEDPEFNIRLGVLKLRKELSNAKGDFAQAAYKYNGNKAIDKFDKRPVRVGYRIRTSESLAQLSKNCLTDSTYVYKITNIAT